MSGPPKAATHPRGCPWCAGPSENSSNEFVPRFPSGGLDHARAEPYWQVRCRACWAQGPKAVTPEDAAARWNAVGATVRQIEFFRFEVAAMLDLPAEAVPSVDSSDARRALRKLISAEERAADLGRALDGQKGLAATLAAVRDELAHRCHELEGTATSLRGSLREAMEERDAAEARYEAERGLREEDHLRQQARAAKLETENARLRELFRWATPLLPHVLEAVSRAVSKLELENVASLRIVLDAHAEALVMELRAGISARRAQPAQPSESPDPEARERENHEGPKT